MKIKNRPYEKDVKCNGCKNAYLINEHLLACDKLKMRNYEYILEIKNFFTKNELEYTFGDIFEDYGLKKLVKLITSYIKDKGIEVKKTNSIFKEPFETYPENYLIMKITKLISIYLKKVDNDQETFNKEKKHKDKLKQESIEKYLKPGKQVP